MANQAHDFVVPVDGSVSHMTMPPDNGACHEFLPGRSEEDVRVVLEHVNGKATWPNAAVIHPKKRGEPFRTMAVNMAKKTEGRQLFYQIDKKHGRVHDAITRLVNETVHAALGTGAILHIKGDLVSYSVGPCRYSQSVAMIGVAPNTPSQRYHLDGPTRVIFKGELACPAYYNIMVPLSDNCSNTDFKGTTATQIHFKAGRQYYTFNGSQWHRGAANITNEWQFKLFVSLVQEDLQKAATLPVIEDSTTNTDVVVFL
jgi:hypothetical protein